MGGDVTQKSLYSVVLKKSVNYQDILDFRVSSGQATGIRIVYLTSSKNGDYADIDIIPQKLSFLKTENFLLIFCPP